jgi:hypothetical protein
MRVSPAYRADSHLSCQLADCTASEPYPNSLKKKTCALCPEAGNSAMSGMTGR